MFKLFVLAALVAVAAAAPQPGVIGAPIVSAYSPAVVAASPLAYSSAYSAPAVAYAGYGGYNGYAASPLAYSAGAAYGYKSYPYAGAYASPYAYIH